MDKESLLIIILIIIIESLVLQIYIPLPTGLILSVLCGFVIVGGAYKIDEYVNKGNKE